MADRADLETREIHAHILKFTDEFFEGAYSIERLVELVHTCNARLSEMFAAINSRGGLTQEDCAAYTLTSTTVRTLLEVISEMATTEYPDLLEKRLRETIRERLKSAPVRLLMPPS